MTVQHDYVASHAVPHCTVIGWKGAEEHKFHRSTVRQKPGKIPNGLALKFTFNPAIEFSTNASSTILIYGSTIFKCKATLVAWIMSVPFTFRIILTNCLTTFRSLYIWNPQQNPCALWQYGLWSFQGRDTKLENVLAKNQLLSNEIIEFCELA